MTKDFSNALYRYFETLYGINQALIILCGVNIFDNKGQLESSIEKVIMDIPRLVPFSFDFGTSDYKLIPKDGLLEFSKEAPFLQAEYEQIFRSHKQFLINVKKVRNKLEHRMHGAEVVASSSGCQSYFGISYQVEEEKYDFEAEEFISFVKDINLLFNRIQILLDQTTTENDVRDYPCYYRLVRYSFADFNKIFDSSLLHIFGKALLPF